MEIAKKAHALQHIKMPSKRHNLGRCFGTQSIAQNQSISGRNSKNLLYQNNGPKYTVWMASLLPFEWMRGKMLLHAPCLQNQSWSVKHCSIIFILRDQWRFYVEWYSNYYWVWNWVQFLTTLYNWINKLFMQRNRLNLKKKDFNVFDNTYKIEPS